MKDSKTLLVVVIFSLLSIIVSAQRPPKAPTPPLPQIPETKTEKSTPVDTADNCEDLVEQGKCYSDRQQTWDICKKSCGDALSLDRKTDGEPEYFKINPSESFYDLRAHTSNNELIDFGIFRGVFTIVMNFSVICQPKESKRAVKGEVYFKNVENLHKIWPEGLQFLIFQYEHPKFNYSEDDCTAYTEASKMAGRPIHVMEVCNLHGPIEDQHPVYQFLHARTGSHRMNYEQPAYFIVSPDGDQIEMHRHTNFKRLREHINDVLKPTNEL